MPVDGFLPLLLVPVIAGVALLLGAVSLGGALAGGVLAAAITLGAGWAGLFMLATLLAAGTLVSSRGQRRRGALQALCNSGVGAAAALAAGFGASWGMVALAGALATALSDTVSAEWGRRWGGNPRALLFGRPLPAGADGAMSGAGTALGACAALLVPAAGLVSMDLRTAGAAAAAGFLGNLLDSAVGLRLQPGWGARGNDWTNLVATFGGAAIAVALAP